MSTGVCPRTESWPRRSRRTRRFSSSATTGRRTSATSFAASSSTPPSTSPLTSTRTTPSTMRSRRSPERSTQTVRARTTRARSSPSRATWKMRSQPRSSRWPATTGRPRSTATRCGATTSNPGVDNPQLMQGNSTGGPADSRLPGGASVGAAAEAVGEAEAASKTFGETRALIDASLKVVSGECHGLVGRNGAGKSTLVTLLTGLTRPDRGSIRLGGQPAPSLADRGAWLAKVACVYQKSMVVPPLTVAENVFLNRPTNGEHSQFVNWRRMRSRAHEVMLEWGFDVDVDQGAERLTVEQRQIVEIARALSIGARFLILDEPTASLEKAAVERLFERVKRLRDGGVGVLYISHHLEEIYEICDRVSVLRDGELVLSGAVSGISQANLIAAMVGSAPPRRATEIEAVKTRAEPGEARLQVEHLVVFSRAGSVTDVSLSVRAGECVGLVGLDGSGSATMADAVVGLVKPRSGTIAINGSPVRQGKV